MVNYFYKWTPLVIVVTVAILSLPWLGLIALTIISLVALAALALVFVVVPYLLLTRAISRRWQTQPSVAGSAWRSANSWRSGWTKPADGQSGAAGSRRRRGAAAASASSFARRAPGRRE
jgi:hypothetical protein